MYETMEEDHETLVEEAYTMFMQENALNPIAFPALRQMEVGPGRVVVARGKRKGKGARVWMCVYVCQRAQTVSPEPCLGCDRRGHLAWRVNL